MKRLVPGFIIGAIAVGVGLALLMTSFVNDSYDIPFSIRSVINPSEAVIIYLSEDSARRLQQDPAQPWDRRLHAELLNRLTEDGVKSVTYDIFFASPARADDPERQKGDQLFAEAIRRNGKVILAADFVFLHQEIGKAMRGMSFMPPFDLVAAEAANLASVELSPDQDLIVRKHLPYNPNDMVAPLAWATAELVGAPIVTNESTIKETRWMNYYGPPETIPKFSFDRVLSTDPNDKPLPSGYFRDKSVFIGGLFKTVTMVDRKDEFPTPFSSWASRLKSHRGDMHFASGLEIHTTIFLNLLRGDWYTRTSEKAERWLVILVGMGAGLLFTSIRPRWAATAAVISSVAVIAIGFYLHTRLHFWFPWNVLALGSIPTAMGGAITYNSFVLYIQKRLFEQSLTLYLSPKLVKKFAGRSDFLQTGAEKQTLTILFSDIANFTSLSEGMDGDKLAQLMNSYFDRAIPNCIFKTDGTVMKYIGDAIFAVWNAPDLQPDHAIRACRAALLLRDSVADATLGESGRPLRTRIGLHTGVANIGNFGSKERFGYDAVGESINLASRMEGLNKYLGTDVLITGETNAETSGLFVARLIGRFRLKGFEKAVEVFELVSERNKEADSESWRAIFADGLENYMRRSLEAAEDAFRRTLELKPNDGPSQFYLERIAELKESAAPGDWDGIVELKEK